MSSSPLVLAIQERLREAGYTDLPTPFKVAGVEFAFTGAMHGKDGRALDLVLLIDTTTGDYGDRDGGRVRQRIEALSRALDVTGSRYVVTAILAGAVLAEGVEALSETCRVLQVEGISLNPQGGPADETAKLQLENRIRLLLPLTLPVSLDGTQSESEPAMDQLVRALPEGTDLVLLDALIVASSSGEQAVTDAVALAISGAFKSKPETEQP